jgi:hypothetical protein
MSVNIIRAGWKGAAWAGLATAALVVTGSSLAAAPRPAGSSAAESGIGPVREEAPLAANAEAVLIVKAGETKEALGFPTGNGRVAKHVKDGFSRAVYDEVTETDAAGEPLSIVQFDGRGLRFAFRLDKPVQAGGRVSQDGAVKAAQRAAGRLGVPIQSVAATDSDPVDGGWVVRWGRTFNGVPVRGDEVRVGVRPDGKIGSLARVEHELVSPPAKPIASGQARALARLKLDGWTAQSEASFAIQDATLEWVEPNAIFDPGRTDSPAGAYRQAWVVTAQPAGPAAEHLRLVALFIDAADGSLIGGDSVE